jgi:hypothetical protein
LRANPARTPEPCDPDTVADAPPIDTGADRFDAPDDLMSRHDRHLVESDVTFAELQIRATDAASDDPSHDHARLGPAELDVSRLERSRGGRTLPFENHGAHAMYT